MSLVAISSIVKPVTDAEFIVECETRPLSEHMWLYFEFSYDKYFTKPEIWTPRIVAGSLDINSLPKNRASKRFIVKGAPVAFDIVGKYETFSAIANGNVVSFDENSEIERVDTAPFDDLIIPDAGIVDVTYSENGVNYATWQTGLDVALEDYDRLYKVAGLVTHVRAVPTTPIAQTVPTPPQVGDPIYVRMRVARV